MTSLKHLTDETLRSETQRLVREERNLLTTILQHLREIERRRLFDGYPSLIAYAIGKLGYSEDAAYRRVAAMRLVRELPEIEQTIERGEITLTHIGIAQSLFRHEKKSGRTLSTEKKAEVFKAIEGRTTREAQRIVAKFSPEPLPQRDQVKPIANERNRVEIELRDATLAKIQRVKGLRAHVQSDPSFDELIDQLCELALDAWDPARSKTKAPSASKPLMSKAEITRQVWKRDNSCCTECHSTYAVQEDHRVPESHGGEYTLENIRLLCRSCNQRAAIEKLGQRKMDPYLNSAAPRKASPATVRESTRAYCAAQSPRIASFLSESRGGVGVALAVEWPRKGGRDAGRYRKLSFKQARRNERTARLPRHDRFAFHGERCDQSSS